MTQKEHDEKVNELRVSLVEAEKQIQDIREELDKLDKVKIEPESRRWKPNRGQTYYFITPDGDIIGDIWAESPYDLLRFAIGNVFETRAEAEFEVERLRVIAELKEFAEPDDREWGSVFNYKGNNNWTITYSNSDHEVLVEDWLSIQNATLYFESKEKAIEAIDTVGKDRIKKYYLRVKE